MNKSLVIMYILIMCGKYKKLDGLKGFKTPPTWDIVCPVADDDVTDADHTP